MGMWKPAPVALFAYRRPDHLRSTLDALEENLLADRTTVTIFCDAPRTAEEVPSTRAVETEARRSRKFGDLEVIKGSQNLGLAGSVVAGVSSVLATSDSVIVLEDDLVTSPSFLMYMNDGLQRFRDDDRVISIHGYSYPTSIVDPFFLRGADCWGWGTWRRGWQLYDADGERLLSELRRRELTDLFDFSGTQSFVRMLEDQIAGRVDSWAIRWYASAFLADRLTLYPGRSLVRNIGNDGSGTHTRLTGRFDSELRPSAPSLNGLLVEESLEARHAFERFFSGSDQVSPSWSDRLRDHVGKVISGLADRGRGR